MENREDQLINLLPFKSNGKWGYINTLGDVVISPAYDSASFFREGVSIISCNNCGGYLSSSGKLLTELVYDDLTFFNDGHAWAKFREEWRLINHDGATKAVLPYSEYQIIHEFSEGFSKFSNNSLFGYLNCNGEVVINPIFSDCSSFSNELAYAAMHGGEYVYIDSRGEVKIESEQYRIGSVFSEGLAMVHTKSLKTAYIDTLGRIVIAPRVESGWYFSDGLTTIHNPVNDKYGYMNKDGNIVINCIYDSATSFHNGIAIVKNGEKVSAINKQGDSLYNLPKNTEVNIEEYSSHPDIISIWLDNDYSNTVYIKRFTGEKIVSFNID